MRRRSFLGALPLAAAAALPFKRVNADADAGAAPAKFQPPGAAKFERPDVHAGDRPAGASWASRSAAYGINGAAGTAHPVATLTAIETLKRGGSAVDAAIAANACLGFLEPTSSGLGGDCFAFVWDPKLNKVVSLAGSGRSPKSLTLEIQRSRAKNGTHSGWKPGVCEPSPLKLRKDSPGRLDQSVRMSTHARLGMRPCWLSHCSTMP